MLESSVAITSVCSRNIFKQKPQQNYDRCIFSNHLFILLLYDTQAKNFSFIVEIGGLGIVTRVLLKCRSNLDDGWALIQTEIDKLTKILDNPDEPQFKSNDYMKLYTIIFNLCTENAPNYYSSELHELYKKVFEDYLNLTVFSSLSDKHNEILLKEFVRRWSNHKVMVQWLSQLFNYLDRYYLPDKNFPLLKEEYFP